MFKSFRKMAVGAEVVRHLVLLCSRQMFDAEKPCQVRQKRGKREISCGSSQAKDSTSGERPSTVLT